VNEHMKTVDVCFDLSKEKENIKRKWDDDLQCMSPSTTIMYCVRCPADIYILFNFLFLSLTLTPTLSSVHQPTRGLFVQILIFSDNLNAKVAFTFILGLLHSSHIKM